VSVFGADYAADAALRRRIGYIPGDFVVDGGQSARELLVYLGNLRGGAHLVLIQNYAERLGLDLGARINSLSKGNRQKIGLVQAFMHRPDLLILDEPTSGLDPLQQQTFIELVREARERGQTVLMSSHVLSEVQRTADRVGIIRDGRMLAVESVDELRARAIRRVEVRFALHVPAAAFRALPGVTAVRVDGPVLRCRLARDADGFIKAIARYPVQGIDISEPDLDELFLTYYREPEASHAA
jgi:ABC-2 type transport system ATP-binding protein